MSHIIRTLKTALVLAPVLAAAACGGDPTGGGGGNLTFPTCKTSDLVITRDPNGVLGCTTLPPGAVTLKKCAAGEAWTSDGKTLSCLPQVISTIDVSTLLMNLDTVDSQVKDYGNKLTMIGGGGPAAKATYIGSTDTPTVGQITFTAAAGQPPVDNGVAAATAQCNQKYMGSRMCSVYDMYNSQVAGVLKSGTAVPRAWVFAASWKYPMAPITAVGASTPWTDPPLNSDTNNAGGPQEGSSDNCGTYTYKTANRHWTGTAVEYNKVQTGDWALRFHAGAASGTAGTAAYEPGAPCNQPLPIACCK